ncbi:MAG: hypothetical protein GEU92_19335 [Alphaproteobacteria bacterium]|nr:hypothetical protein [Alphaproteobacteria bacterium]
MSDYDLERFCVECRDALSADSGAKGREAVRRCVEKLLSNPAFVAAHVPVPRKKGRTVLHRDAETGFCVMAHGTPEGNGVGRPHDHGASWAVYGQAHGVTEMTVWRRTDSGEASGRAEIEPAQTFALEPGRAALFDTGVIHNTAHPRPAAWVRVTGADLDRIERHRYDPARKTMERMTAE